MLTELTFDETQPMRLDTDALHLRVYRQLAGMVMGGMFKPGQELTLRSLADMVGTSEMPVRDAVRRLITVGALEMRPGRRIGIPTLSAGQLREIYRLRILLESEAAGIAAQTMSDADLTRLAEIHHQIGAADGVDDTGRRLWNLNREFHFRIVAAAQMPRLSSFVEALWLQTGPLVNDLPLRVSQTDMVHHHAPLLAALREKDSKKSAEALAADLSSAVTRMLGELNA